MQKNKQELEILRHKVEHFQTSGGGSGDSYTKAQTNALLSAKADKSTTYTKTETNTAISSAISDIFADDPIKLNVDSETNAQYFPTDKLDIPRLHKPLMVTAYTNLIWYCTCDDTDYEWIYFAINLDDIEAGSPIYYMSIDQNTKEVKFDLGYSVTTEEDLAAATITGGTINSDASAITNYYLDKAVTELKIGFTATSNISANADIIEFNGKKLPWNFN